MPVRLVHRRRPTARGAALVEVAVVLPVLVLIMIGVIDFGRVFYTAMALTNAAHAGALYGALSKANANNVTGIQNAVQNSATPDIGNLDAPASVTVACTCQATATVGTTVGSNMGSCTATCSNPSDGTSGFIRTTVTVTATKSFSTLSPFLSSSVWRRTLSRSFSMRVGQ